MQPLRELRRRRARRRGVKMRLTEYVFFWVSGASIATVAVAGADLTASEARQIARSTKA